MKKYPIIHLLILTAFLINGSGPLPGAQADDLRLPLPGVMVRLSPPLEPPTLKGIKIHADNPLRFDFILDKGDVFIGDDHQDQLKDEATKLIKYFLASLTVPEQELWVNLSPYEKDRIIPASFGMTEMGRDLLAEDYMLKQVTASLIYPEDQVGRKFWKRVYEEAAKKFGTTNIPVSTFNKVWIVPEKAVVYENAQAGTAYVVEARLKVMLEEDYLSLSRHAAAGAKSDGPGVNKLGSDIVREIVIPELTKEVNEDKNFVKLRQVFNSLILATWYKKKIKDSILEQIYADKNKVAGVGYASSANDVEIIYQRYLKAFKKGVYNYIKEDVDLITREPVPRKYFSGGMDLSMGATQLETKLQTVNTIDRALLNKDNLEEVSGQFDAAMASDEKTLMDDAEVQHFFDHSLPYNKSLFPVYVTYRQPDLESIQQKVMYSDHFPLSQVQAFWKEGRIQAFRSKDRYILFVWAPGKRSEWEKETGGKPVNQQLWVPKNIEVRIRFIDNVELVVGPDKYEVTIDNDKNVKVQHVTSTPEGIFKAEPVIVPWGQRQRSVIKGGFVTFSKGNKGEYKMEYLSSQVLSVLKWESRPSSAFDYEGVHATGDPATHNDNFGSVDAAKGTLVLTNGPKTVTAAVTKAVQSVFSKRDFSKLKHSEIQTLLEEIAAQGARAIDNYRTQHPRASKAGVSISLGVIIKDIKERGLLVGINAGNTLFLRRTDKRTDLLSNTLEAAALGLSDTTGTPKLGYFIRSVGPGDLVVAVSPGLLDSKIIEKVISQSDAPQEISRQLMEKAKAVTGTGEKTNDLTVAVLKISQDLTDNAQLASDGATQTFESNTPDLSLKINISRQLQQNGLPPALIDRIFQIEDFLFKNDTLPKGVSWSGRSIIIPLSAEEQFTYQGRIYKVIRIKGSTDNGHRPKLERYITGKDNYVQQSLFHLIIEKQKDGKEIISYEPSEIDPQGGMILNFAIREYQSMSDVYNAGISTALPLGYGDFTDMRFENKKLGFTIFAEEQNPIPSRLAAMFRERLTGKKLDTYFQDLGKAVLASGKLLGELHRAGYTHSNPHLDQFGYQDESLARIYDFETTYDTSQVKSRNEFIYRVLFDFRVFYQSVDHVIKLFGRLTTGQVVQASPQAREAYKDALEGYFSPEEMKTINEQDASPLQLMELFSRYSSIQDTHGKDIEEVIKGLSGQNTVMAELSRIAGRIWDRAQAADQAMTAEDQKRVADLKELLGNLNEVHDVPLEVRPYTDKESPPFGKIDPIIRQAIENGEFFEVQFKDINRPIEGYRDPRVFNLNRAMMALSVLMENSIKEQLPEWSGMHPSLSFIELFKNALFHGNSLDVDLPLFVRVNKSGIDVVDFGLGDPKQPWPDAVSGPAMMAGAGQGVQYIRGLGWNSFIQALTPLTTSLDDQNLRNNVTSPKEFKAKMQEFIESGQHQLGTVIHIEPIQKALAHQPASADMAMTAGDKLAYYMTEMVKQDQGRGDYTGVVRNMIYDLDLSPYVPAHEKDRFKDVSAAGEFYSRTSAYRVYYAIQWEIASKQSSSLKRRAQQVKDRGEAKALNDLAKVMEDKPFVVRNKLNAKWAIIYEISRNNRLDKNQQRNFIDSVKAAYRDRAMTVYGGIDLTPARMDLQTNTGSGAGVNGIAFHLDPAMLRQLQNATGFVPVIINIKPMNDLGKFLGVNEAQQTIGV